MHRENLCLGRMNTLFQIDHVKSTKKVDYMIDLAYGKKDWDMSSALREIIANAIDTKSQYYYEYKNGIATIQDQGTGLPKKAFVMGSSSKASDETSIGQFGEGLKMCLVTALRYKKKVSISTVGYGVEAEAVHSDEYGTDMMRIYFTDLSIDKVDPNTSGTIIKVECDQEDYKKALEMFLQFRAGYKKLERNLYLPGGYLSILGLTTEERPNMLFSYDLKDKSLTNRDRNTVKTKKLKTEMEKILSGIRHKETVTLYLKGMKDNPEYEEYKIVFEPKYKEVWIAAIKELYGENAVFQTTPEADIKAVYKGMKVIPCPTKAVRKVLEAVEVKSSAQKTKNIKAKNIQLQDANKITYPISRNYVEKWNILDAGREIIANALDASGQEASVKWENGTCIIEDKGSGISRKHFVIGNSQKHDEQIGLFGEGFKLAALVMARENRNMLIETAGFTYKPVLENSEEFGTEIFCIHYEENKRKQGTRVIFKATEKETGKMKAMFICFQDGCSPIYSTPELDIYPLNEKGKGVIYVNGLQTATMDTIYSYNIKDRRLVDTRDRNHVDDVKLSSLLTDFYNHVSDVEIIDRIMTAWQTSTLYKEYSLILNPEVPMFWYGEVDKCFPNCCIESMQNWRSNFVASQAGYKILKNIPPYILKVLSNSLKTADEIAEQYKGKGIGLGNRILYPITDEYLPNWSVEDACTELISNAIDTGKFLKAAYENGTVVIEDEGVGLRKENFLIGCSSSNKIGKAIGAFGEGLKLACLIISRNSSEGVNIETQDFSAHAYMSEDIEFHAKILCIEISEAKNVRTGTKITFKASEAAIKNAKGRFLIFDEYKKEVADGIFENVSVPGIYVNGIRIREAKALYTYNLTGSFAKNILSRDRKSFTNSYESLRMVFQLISEITKEELIETYITNVDMGLYESEVFFENVNYFSYGQKRRWLKIAKRVYPNAAVAYDKSNVELQLLAKDHGITILDVNYCIEKLLRAIGFPSIEDAIRESKKDEIEVIVPSKLNAKEKKRYDTMMEIAVSEYGTVIAKKIKIAKVLNVSEKQITLGLYAPFQNTIYLYLGLLDENRYAIEELLGTLDHEVQHFNTGADDRTREFEHALTNRIGVLLKDKYHQLTEE